MYLDHFGLRTDPFPLYPSLKFVFMSTPFEETMAHLAYGIENDEDIILITGPIGTGKTLAVQSLLSNLGKLYRTAFVNVTQVDFGELLKLVLADLGAPLTGAVDRGDLLGALKEQVRQARERGNKILIVVDEAQNLALETLEGLRLLTNLGQPDGQSVQLVLVGQPDLERKIALPQLAQLRQRIRVHYRIETLNRKELEAYIVHRLKVAGVEKPLFKPRAVDLIHRASAGVPRLVNILCSRALLSAFVAGRPEIDVEHVDLDDLPPAVGQEGGAAPVVARPATAPIATAAPAAAPASAPAVAPASAPAVAPGPPPPVSVPAPAPPAPALRPAVAPPVARADAPPVDASAAAARPFEPMGAYHKRNQRSRVAFLVAILLLAIAAFIVFRLQPARSGSRPGPEQAAARGGAGRSPVGSPAERPDDASPVAAQASPPGVDSLAVNATPTGGPATVEAPARAPAAATALPAAAEPAGSPVSVAANDSLTAAPPPAATLGTPGVWAVHVHSFHDTERSDTDIARFREAGYPSFFRSALVDGLTWQRVYLGPYSSLDEARTVAARVSAAGLSSYAQVVKIGNGDQ